MTGFIIDTNLIIRYLVNDDPEKSKKVEQLLSSNQKIYLYDIVISEIAWVLISKYQVSRKEAAEKLHGLINLQNVISNKELITLAANIWEKKNIDFVDAYLLAASQINSIEKIYSFDKNFVKSDAKVVEIP